MRLTDNGAWLLWKKIARRIATFQARAILALLYFTVLIPFAVLSRIGRNPFKAAGWNVRAEATDDARQNARQQF